MERYKICSHAVLYIANVHVCTKVYFSASGQVKFSTIEEMNFSKPKLLQCCKQPSKKIQSVTKDSSISLDAFYSRLSESSPQASILLIIPDHLKNFIPQSCSKDFPDFLISISALYDSKYLDVPYDKLLQECEKVFDRLCISPEQSSMVEQHTRDQAKSRLWFYHRAGRITASRFKTAGGHSCRAHTL